MKRAEPPATSTAPQGHMLQPMLAPLPGAPELLYFAAGSAGVVAGPGGGLKMAPGGRLQGASYFNAFFLDYWRAHTGVARLGLACRAGETVVLRVLGRFGDGSQRCLNEWQHPGGGVHHIEWLWSRAEDQGGGAPLLRLHLEIEAPAGAEIDQIGWVCDSAPINSVRLSVGLCTFEREAHLLPTVTVLQGLLAAGEVARVRVVNQGRRFRLPGLAALVETPGFDVIEQANLGGTGGFARAMVATIAAAEAPTHLLILDDDIVLDARIVTRARLFAAHATRPCAVGGQAIETEAPTRLHELGGLLGPNWMVRTMGHGADLGSEAALTIWDRDQPVDYNAWWFLLLPLDAIRRCGLPAPVFLHGDDIEYGLRLREAGVETVPLPGLGVWHSSFRYKHAGLVHYYDLRNMLINASAHPDVSNLPGPVFVLGWMIHYLLVHRYRAALASMTAIRDFLAGPEVALGPDSLTRHHRLRATIDRIAAPSVREGVVAADLKHAPTGTADPSQLRQAVLYVRLVLRILFVPDPRDITLLVSEQPLPENTQGAPYLLATGPHADRCLVLRRRRWRFVMLGVQALALALRYAIGHRRAARHWAAAMDDLRSRARWEREFSRART